MKDGGLNNCLSSPNFIKNMSIRLNLLALPSTSSASGAFAEVLSSNGTRSSEDVLRGGEPRVSNSGKVSTLVSVSVV